MIPEADFVDAHRRHWKDAELLFEHERWANADHLYGFSAECGLKAVMASLGMPVDSRGAPQRKYRKHLPDIWLIFGHFAKGRGKRQYVLIGDPFSGWSIHDRYANRSHFERACVVPHKCAAGQVCRVVERAERDGVL